MDTVLTARRLATRRLRTQFPAICAQAWDIDASLGEGKEK
jgi:hypothetical protein